MTPNNWIKEWNPIADAAYLNTAGHAVMPRVSLAAVEAAMLAKAAPHRMDDSRYFEAPDRLRQSLSNLIGAHPDEIALTTGASTGLAFLAYGLSWKPGDEIITAAGEFPAQYATWHPMESRSGVNLKMVRPGRQFLDAGDLIAAITPRTKLISVSHVRFDDGSLMDCPRLADVCHARGVLLAVDVSQSCGAVPFEVEKLGADFLVCAGYKWLLSPSGTGFFWIKRHHLASLLPGPFYWTSQASTTFARLNLTNPEPAPGAKRWDSAEAATYFNFNLTAMAASVEFVAGIKPGLLLEHNHELVDKLFAGLPENWFPASPLDHQSRGPFGCFAAATPDETSSGYRRLREAGVIVSLREGRIRVSPHLFNSSSDVSRIIDILREKP